MVFDVLIVGGGPTGLFLGCELRLSGADPLVVERSSTLSPTKTLGLRSISGRTIQTLELRGLLGRFAEQHEVTLQRLAGGSQRRPQPHRANLRSTADPTSRFKGYFGGFPLMCGADDIDDVPNAMLLRQAQIENLLAVRAAELGVAVQRGKEIVALDESPYGVTARLHTGETVNAQFVVGCDGGGSVTRKLAGFDFTGTAPSMTAYVACIRLTDPSALPEGVSRYPGGVLTWDANSSEVTAWEFNNPPYNRDSAVSVEEVQTCVRRISGLDVTITEMMAGARFSDNTRQAPTYRRGRVLLAGDAAHVHSPISGQGLNLGLQDAANLGWKLALTTRGLASEGLVDTYTTERHPVAAKVLHDTQAQVALMKTDPSTQALRDVLGDLIAIPQTRRHLLSLVNGTDIRYDVGSDHPVAGRFAPDFLLADGKRLRRMLQSAPDGHGVLVDLGDSPQIRKMATGWPDRVAVLHTSCVEHPGIRALLVRPDGYTACVVEHEHDREAVEESLIRWFGPANPA